MPIELVIDFGVSLTEPSVGGSLLRGCDVFERGTVTDTFSVPVVLTLTETLFFLMLM